MIKKGIIQSFIYQKPLPAFLLLWGVLILVFGIPTALIPNPVLHYVRMIPPVLLDYFFLFSVTGLLSANVVLFFLKQQKASVTITAGGIIGFLSMACPTCNFLLMSLLGGTFILAYIEPLRPLLGLLSILWLGIFLILQWGDKNCSTCILENKGEFHA